ncbi:MAG: hypothetical protein D6813_02105 [Calditrichaeota bacterium]|nr:MAG: hypothetical protein D6813_02105 [Calditrichota bacterium]
MSRLHRLFRKNRRLFLVIILSVVFAFLSIYFTKLLFNFYSYSVDYYEPKDIEREQLKNE